MKQKKQPLLSEISRRNKLRLLKKNCPLGCSILEVGTGSGWFAEQLREAGYNVTTMDIVGSADIVGNITNWQQLGMKAGSFDAVVALEVIEHVDCLSALQELCKPNGLIILSSPHPKWDWAMKLLETFHLNQKRTSEHNNLTDFQSIEMPAKVMKRPLMIHQVAIFVNASLDKAPKVHVGR